MLLGVDKRGFTQRVEREGVKLENREGQTERETEMAKTRARWETRRGR